MSLGDAAAKLGVPVFPCAADKRPVTDTGFKAASCDPASVIAAFARPSAEMIGMPTGFISGFVVIDVDIRAARSGMAWLDEHKERLPETRTIKTRSGGLHLYFLQPPRAEIRNSASRVASGVDVRGEGGYVIVPPSPGYSVADDSPAAIMPLWLVQACLRPEPPDREHEARPRRQAGGSSRYGLAALEGECEAIRSAGFGGQEMAINNAGLKIGALIAGGELLESVALAELLAAARAVASEPGKPPWRISELEAKIRRAVSDGKASPRYPPPPRGDAPKTNGSGPPPPNNEAEYGSDAQSERHAGTETATDDAGAGEYQEPPKPALEVVYFDDISPCLDVADFVEGLLTRAGMSVVYGQSNSGKTFWTSDVGLHLAAGMPWCGRAVERGGVLWLAMEGHFGIQNRVSAWRLAHHISGPIPFAVVPVTLDLLHPDADIHALLQTIGAVQAFLGMKVTMTVVDTLSRAISGGNENSPEDMGALVTNGAKIQQQTGSHVTWIHHSGKDEAKGARGHSLLRAATDTEIEITSDGARRAARVTKQREMECVGEFLFGLKVVELGRNRRGKPVTSCVVEATSASEGQAAPRRHLTGHTKRALEVLVNLVAQSGRTGDVGVPPGFSSVPAPWWRESFYQNSQPDADPDTKKHAFNRASAALVNEHLVGMGNDRVWIVHFGSTHGGGHETGQ